MYSSKLCMVSNYIRWYSTSYAEQYTYIRLQFRVMCSLYDAEIGNSLPAISLRVLYNV